MSLGAFIRWCSCGRRILTTRQIQEKKPCDICQKEHAQTLRERLNIEDSAKEFNGT
jgi:hypothetical protein